MFVWLTVSFISTVQKMRQTVLVQRVEDGMGVTITALRSEATSPRPHYYNPLPMQSARCGGMAPATSRSGAATPQSPCATVIFTSKSYARRPRSLSFMLLIDLKGCIGDGLVLPPARTHIARQVIPKCRCAMALGARGGPAPP